MILAAGGCAWKSGSLGSNVNTGDGYLMGAEVGVSLSGMEFSNYYGIVPKGGSMDKNGFNMVSTFYDADGNVVQSGWSGAGGANGARATLIRAYLEGPIFQRMDLAPVEAREGMRAQMPNFFVNLDRLGIDPFEDRYRGRAGQRGHRPRYRRRSRRRRHLLDRHPRPLGRRRHRLARGDRRRLIGGGRPERRLDDRLRHLVGRAAAARALAANGRAATQHSRAAGADAFRGLTGAGQAGLRPTGTRLAADAWRELTSAIQAEINDPAKNGLRSHAGMETSLDQLEQIWREVRTGLGGVRVATSEDAREQVSERETAAMAASARWAYLSASARTESRAMHVRDDFPETDPRQRHRILVRGVDQPDVTFARIEDPMDLEFDYAEEAAA